MKKKKTLKVFSLAKTVIWYCAHINHAYEALHCVCDVVDNLQAKIRVTLFWCKQQINLGGWSFNAWITISINIYTHYVIQFSILIWHLWIIECLTTVWNFLNQFLLA